MSTHLKSVMGYAECKLKKKLNQQTLSDERKRLGFLQRYRISAKLVIMLICSYPAYVKMSIVDLLLFDFFQQ